MDTMNNNQKKVEPPVMHKG